MKQFKTAPVQSKSNKLYTFTLYDNDKVVKKFIVSTPLEPLALACLARKHQHNGLEDLDNEVELFEGKPSVTDNVYGLARFLDTLDASSYEEEREKLTIEVTPEEKKAILTALKIKRALR